MQFAYNWICVVDDERCEKFEHHWEGHTCSIIVAEWISRLRGQAVVVKARMLLQQKVVVSQSCGGSRGIPSVVCIT